MAYILFFWDCHSGKLLPKRLPAIQSNKVAGLARWAWEPINGIAIKDSVLFNNFSDYLHAI